MQNRLIAGWVLGFLLCGALQAADYSMEDDSSCCYNFACIQKMMNPCQPKFPCDLCETNESDSNCCSYCDCFQKLSAQCKANLFCFKCEDCFIQCGKIYIEASKLLCCTLADGVKRICCCHWEGCDITFIGSMLFNLGLMGAGATLWYTGNVVGGAIAASVGACSCYAYPLIWAAYNLSVPKKNDSSYSHDRREIQFTTQYGTSP